MKHKRRTLDLVPAGAIQSIVLAGAPLDNVPTGTPSRVMGVVRSYLHIPVKDALRAQVGSPPQWNIYLLVTELEILNDPMIMIERKKEEMLLKRREGE